MFILSYVLHLLKKDFCFSENEYLYTNITFWIGLNDSKQEGNFVWLDDTQKVRSDY